MDKDKFKQLFEAAIETVVRDKEKRSNTTISRDIQIELQGLGYSGDTLDVDTVVNILFLGENTFYRIIDVAFLRATPQKATVFVRVSGHSPTSLEETWNDPPGSGPFKPMVYTEPENWPPAE
jgi:hypothetical protein